MSNIPDSFDEKQLCQVLGISPKTAQSWRHKGRGPAWYRMGRRLVRYRAEDVQSWMEQGRVDGGR
ncbi:helix-turn-helix transcriptional regulator [Desulfurivibrio sp. C05AmB]|uniref:helix-turn-helix transcriptional regulator n=1 Tax=Desulfurivibrio sp. C05AmB TaxID=3374371 RepID=UPI00376EFEA1